MGKRNRSTTPSFEPAEDLSAQESYPPDTSSGEWVEVETPYGIVQMTRAGAKQYYDTAHQEHDADDLS